MNGSNRIRFGRYLLLERLAVGGMAELYRAVLPGPSGFEKTVAIKKILPELARSEQFCKMFLHEGRIMAALSHRNLVQVLDMGEVAGELFLCLEYVAGCDLAAVIDGQQGRALEPYLAAHITREIAQGLQYVHTFCDERGQPMRVVHRDINPHNVLLSRQGDVKLGDFGIAKSVVDDVRTRQGQIKGKLEYLSPEQAQGASVSPHSDLYLLGLVLFEMLTAERYIRGKGDLELMRFAANPQWRSIRETNPRVPSAIEDIVERMLRPEPERRFPNADALLQALATAMARASHQPGSADVARLVTPVSTAITEIRDKTHPAARVSPTTPIEAHLVKARPVPPPAKDRPRTLTLSAPSPAPAKSRKLTWWIGSGALGLSLILALVLFTLRQPEEPAQTQPVKVVEPAALPESIGQPAPPSAVDKEEELSLLVPAPAVTDPPRPQGRKRPPRLPVKRWPERSEPARAAPIKKPDAPGETPRVAEAVDPDAGIDALGSALQRQRSRLAEKGVRSRDVPAIDALLLRAARQIAARDAKAANPTLQTLEHEIDSLSIGRAFVERKMLRLEKSLRQTNQQEKFATQTRAILNLAVNSRFTEANAAINRVLDEIEDARP